MTCKHETLTTNAARVVCRTAQILDREHTEGSFTFDDFQNHIVTISDYKRGSVLPSDYCYNLINKWEGSFCYPLLEWVERGRYRFLGPDYPYTGDVFWKGERVGTWRDGACTLFHDPRE